MGFAGQVFAARIAVGLAVPSASALSRTGGMLAKGAAGIYTALNSQRKQQAAKRVTDAKAEVDRISGLAADIAKKQSNQIANEAARGMRKLENAGAANKAALGKSGAGAFAEMKATMGAEGTAMFKGVEKAVGPMQKLITITKNYAKMSKAQQGAAIIQAKEFEKAKIKQVDAIKAEREANKSALSALRDGATEKTKAFKDEEKLLETRIKQGDRKLEQARKERASAIKEAEVVRTISVEARQAEIKALEKAGFKGEELKKAIEELDKAEREAAESTKDLTTSAAEFGGKVTDVANDMAKNFNAVLLETVATLSAFYYKLNQNTEALIEFERELINANSVWQETDEVLFAAGEQVTQFGQTFGMNMQNGATGLYQLASAGLTASESMEVLGNTLKLSMAVQGDHNTIAKLTTQTLRGFDMEMTESAEVTDKFAHAIQKSLIEYEDLSSAVKFALPFFTSTGQSIDQLLGSLQVLTNRALEAGIAGRGLRQALAQFAKHAENNDAAFRKMGISVLNAEGNMRQLSDIAADFAAVVGEDTVNNTELLTSLIDDLNVRGATAFVHLVQASDEFTQAVEDTAGAGGELDKMVEKQNESLTAQIQILKNNVQMIFQMSDATYVAEGYMNEFHKTVSLMIADLQGLIVEGEDGSKTLTDFGMSIQDIAVSGMKAMHELLLDIIPVIRDFSKQGLINVEMLRLYTLPLRMVVRLLELMGPNFTKLVLSFYIWNKILPITTILQTFYNITLLMTLKAIADNTAAEGLKAAATEVSMFATIKASVAEFYAAQTLKVSTFWQKMRTLGLWGSILAMGTYIGTQLGYIASTIAATAATAALWIVATGGIIILAAIAYGIGKVIYQSEAFQAIIKRITEPGGTMYWWKNTLAQVYEIVIALGKGFIWLGKMIATGISMAMAPLKGLANAVGILLSPMKKLGFLANKDGILPRIVGAENAAQMEKFSGHRFSANEGAIFDSEKIDRFATGGYIRPMASGGYLVGERGPELFKPNGGGQVLNNTATNHIMGQNADSGFSNGRGNMTVSSLTVESAEMNQSNLNIDSFAGNPAMRRAV